METIFQPRPCQLCGIRGRALESPGAAGESRADLKSVIVASLVMILVKICATVSSRLV